MFYRLSAAVRYYSLRDFSLAGLDKVLINRVGDIGGLCECWLSSLLVLVIVSATWLIHGDLVLRVHVDAKTDCIAVEVIDGVEVLQEGVTDEEQVFVLAGQPALVDDEVAFLMARLIEVLFWVDFKDVVTHLETNWLHLWCDVFAALLHVAECFV